MAQKKKISERQIILALKKSGGVVTNAAELLGVCRQTLAKRIKGNEKLEAAQEQSMAHIVDVALVSLMDKLKDPKYKSDTLIIFVLKSLGNRVYKNAFQEKQIVENIGEGKPVILIAPPEEK